MTEGSLGRFFLRVSACHMVTYFVAGILAFTLLDYETAFRTEHFACWMRPTSSKWIALGPGLQQIRGLSEVVGQSLAFSLLLVAWYRRPHRAWGRVLYPLTALVALMSIAGAVVPRP